ncbi:MAG: tetratricopeptide repeat protein [Bernardetiaceae bacterium]|nr:tetratricopeptide repeat protein [Bernardetiaceae bacterium]
MKNILISVILFLFISNFDVLLAQGTSNQSYYENMYRNAKHDTTKVNALIQIGRLYFSSKPDTVVKIYEHASHLAKKANDKRGLSKVKYNLAEFYALNIKYDSALNYYEQALAMFSEAEYPKSVANILEKIGELYSKQSNYTVALEYYQKSRKIHEKLDNKEGVAQSLLTIGKLYYYQANYPVALEYCQKSLRINENIGNNYGIAMSLLEIGNIYFQQGDLTLSLEEYKKSLKLLEGLNNKKDIAAVLNNIINANYMQGNTNLVLEDMKKVLKLNEELGDKAAVAISLNNIGKLYDDFGNYDLALDYHQKSIKIKKELGDKFGQVYSYYGIASVHYKQGDYDTSIAYAEKGLAIAQEIKAALEASGLAEILFMNYNSKEDYRNALEYFAYVRNIQDSLFSLEKSKAISNLKSTIELERKAKELDLLEKNNQLIQIEATKKLQELELIKKQNEVDRFLALAQKEKDKRKQDSLYNLAQKTQLEAKNMQIENQNKELALKSEIEAQKRVQYTYIGIIATFLIILILVAIGLKQKQKANKMLAAQNEEIQKQQHLIAEKNIFLNQANEELHQHQEELTVLNENLEMQKLAVEKSFQSLGLLSEIGKAINTSLDVKEIIHIVNVQVNALMKVEGFGIGLYNEQQNCLDFEGYIEQDKELAFHQDDLNNPNLLSSFCFNNQKEILINNFPAEYQKYIEDYDVKVGKSSIKSIIYMPLNDEGKRVGVITVQSFQINAYQEQHLSILHHIANYSANALAKADAFRYINKQKVTIESTYKKLKRTTEQFNKSIQYASHIQSVVMPEESELRNYFSDLFVIFKPKDIVSGDFYWFSQISEDMAVFSLADCTGHGVPGAFMSMLGSTILHEAVNIKKNYNDPASILKSMHNGIRKILKQEQKKNNDGMDISLCVFKKNKTDNTVELIFTGAKSKMSYIIDNQIFDLKGDRQYLGGGKLKKEFTNHRLILPENTLFYLYSDGYQDQNNPDREKIGSTNFKNQLLACKEKNFAEQKKYLEYILNEHQKNAEQRDDISVIGLRV